MCELKRAARVCTFVCMLCWRCAEGTHSHWVLQHLICWMRVGYRLAHGCVVALLVCMCVFMHLIGCLTQSASECCITVTLPSPHVSRSLILKVATEFFLSFFLFPQLLLQLQTSTEKRRSLPAVNS